MQYRAVIPQRGPYPPRPGTFALLETAQDTTNGQQGLGRLGTEPYRDFHAPILYERDGPGDAARRICGIFAHKPANNFMYNVATDTTGAMHVDTIEDMNRHFREELAPPEGATFCPITDRLVEMGYMDATLISNPHRQGDARFMGTATSAGHREVVERIANGTPQNLVVGAKLYLRFARRLLRQQRVPFHPAPIEVSLISHVDTKMPTDRSPLNEAGATEAVYYSYAGTLAVAPTRKRQLDLYGPVPLEVVLDFNTTPK
jgi:hypothetical protein